MPTAGASRRLNIFLGWIFSRFDWRKWKCQRSDDLPEFHMTTKDGYQQMITMAKMVKLRPTLLLLLLLPIACGKTPDQTVASGAGSTPDSEITTADSKTTDTSATSAVRRLIESNERNGLHVLSNRNARRLIIFVHGFTGDSVETWRHERTAAYWPEMILKDQAFLEADIAVYGFPSSVFEKSFSIDEVADNLRLRLDSISVKSEYDEMVFVAHSLGGLIVRAFALKYRDYPRIPLAYFYATPSNGADLANIATIISDNNQVLGLRKLQENLFLQSQSAQWFASPLKASMRSYCAYETTKTNGLMVVPRESATALCNERLDPIAENHIRIVKPANEQSDAYVSFKVAYQETFQRLRLVTKGKTLNIDISQPSLEVVNGVAVLDSLTITNTSVTVPDNTLIVANDIFLDNGTLKGKGLSIVAAGITGGTIDASGALGENGGELLLAAGNILGTKIIATGGEGTDGENGIDGLDGAPGAGGSDGDCRPFGKYEGARDGEPGQSGANGSDGSDGSGGGNGGDVFVVAMNHLTLQPIVTGGIGGNGGGAGQAGHGGQGGRGGRGCTGLGGTQSNAKDGLDGLGGRSGRGGVDGNAGKPGNVWSRQIESFSRIAEIIPREDEIQDYADEIKTSLKALARSG